MSGASPTPLVDLRVVEISDRIAGAYCGKLLVDAGADVVKVEPATGDPLRRFTATGAVPPTGTDAPLFSYLNSGKRSLTASSGSLGTVLGRADIVLTRESPLFADQIASVVPQQFPLARLNLPLVVRLDTLAPGMGPGRAHW